jgi:hypothetical protein
VCRGGGGVIQGGGIAGVFMLYALCLLVPRFSLFFPLYLSLYSLFFILSSGMGRNKDKDKDKE